MRVKRQMNWMGQLALASVFGILPALSGGTARAGDSPEAAFLQQEIAARVPANWQVHVSTRDTALVIFLTPPYQEAFDLWYQPEKLREKMLALCPGAGDAIWTKLPPGKSVDIQPTVGGKSADAMRLICSRKTPPPA